MRSLKTMSARTPGPWYVGPPNHGFDISIGATNPVSGNPVWIGRVYGPSTINGSHVETRNANADFIVEACNAYDTLTAENAALRDALMSIKDHPGEFSAIEDHDTMVYRMVEKARAALAQGKGRG